MIPKEVEIHFGEMNRKMVEKFNEVYRTNSPFPPSVYHFEDIAILRYEEFLEKASIKEIKEFYLFLQGSVLDDIRGFYKFESKYENVSYEEKLNSVFTKRFKECQSRNMDIITPTNLIDHRLFFLALRTMNENCTEKSDDEILTYLTNN